MKVCVESAPAAARRRPDVLGARQRKWEEPAHAVDLVAPREEWPAGLPSWFEAYVALDGRVRAVELLAMLSEDDRTRAYVSHRVERLDRVRDALFDLHRDVATTPEPPLDSVRRSLTTYVDTGHAWCGEVLDSLAHRATGQLLPAADDSIALSQRSAAFVTERLDPQYRALVAACGALAPRAEDVGPLVRRAADVREKISAFCWAPAP